MFSKLRLNCKYLKHKNTTGQTGILDPILKSHLVTDNILKLPHSHSNSYVQCRNHRSWAPGRQLHSLDSKYRYSTPMNKN